jgi:amino acid transporter
MRRVALGRPVRGFRPGAPGTKSVRIRVALPLLASDALSSVAYAPDEILLTLAAAGLAGMAVGPWVGLAIAAVMAVVIASYRQTIRAYPGGGGDYTVARTNLGPLAGATVGGAMMVDSVLTVAVSVSSGAQYFAAIIPPLEHHALPLAVALVAVLMAVSLRGVKALAPTVVVAVYAFMAALGVTALVGGVQFVTGTLHDAATAGLTVVPASGFEAGLTGIGGAFLVLRAFSSGAVALTGVQTISTGVPMFRRPKARNAARSLTFLGIACAVLLVGVLVMANRMGVRFVDNPATGLLRDGKPVGPGFHQEPVLAQIVEAIYQSWTPVAVAVIALVGLLLILAASTAFRWVPALMSLLAHDEFLPKQFYRRGDRRVAAHGIITLGIAAMVLIVLFDAKVTRLIQLYIVGVFISFTLSQLGMIRHWNALIPLAETPKERRRMVMSRLVNAVGLALTSVTLVIVVVTKFTHGAWITVVAVGLAVWAMAGVHGHYRKVTAELDVSPGDRSLLALPSRVHAIVLVSSMNRSTARAVAYARATRPSSIEALTVAVDQRRVRQLRKDWDAADVPITLRIMDSPSREITVPLVQYITEMRRRSPRDLVMLYIPEKVVGHWWERWLHNRSAARLTSRLRHVPGVVIASVPWQLNSSEVTT